MLDLARRRELPSLRIGRRRRFSLARVGEALGADLSAGPLLTADDLAHMLAVKRERVHELSRRLQDPIPSVWVGRLRRYSLRDLEEWVERQGEG